MGGSLKAILEFINEQFFIDTATNLVQMKDSIKNVSPIFFPTFNSKSEGLGESLCRGGMRRALPVLLRAARPSFPFQSRPDRWQVWSRVLQVGARWSGSGGEVKERFWDRLPVA